ncbi:hypothetical protein F4805DRAFT_459994 [Annulohypoxylon moriforme]|nr:hypothetical protein F4805DRAFT_459994 [Annulohypoxylon moriforme]
MRLSMQLILILSSSVASLPLLAEHGDWPGEYPGKGDSKNVDDTSKRSDWVTSYDNKANSKNVDDTSKRSDWVTSYDNKANSKNVDDTSKRSDWVTSYDATPKLGYWVPSGPSYLELDFSPIHRDHLVTLATGQRLYTENLSGFKRTVARFIDL